MKVVLKMKVGKISFYISNYNNSNPYRHLEDYLKKFSKKFSLPQTTYLGACFHPIYSHYIVTLGKVVVSNYSKVYYGFETKHNFDIDLPTKFAKEFEEGVEYAEKLLVEHDEITDIKNIEDPERKLEENDDGDSSYGYLNRDGDRVEWIEDKRKEENEQYEGGDNLEEDDEIKTNLKVTENRKFEENKMQKEESKNSINNSETVEELLGKDQLNIKDNILCKQDKRIENSNHDYEEEKVESENNIQLNPIALRFSYLSQKYKQIAFDKACSLILKKTDELANLYQGFEHDFLPDGFTIPEEEQPDFEGDIRTQRDIRLYFDIQYQGFRYTAPFMVEKYQISLWKVDNYGVVRVKERYFTPKADKVLNEDFKGFTLISSESSILIIENQENCLLPSLVLVIDPFSLEIIFELDVMLYNISNTDEVSMHNFKDNNYKNIQYYKSKIYCCYDLRYLIIKVNRNLSNDIECYFELYNLNSCAKIGKIDLKFYPDYFQVLSFKTDISNRKILYISALGLNCAYLGKIDIDNMNCESLIELCNSNSHINNSLCKILHFDFDPSKKNASFIIEDNKCKLISEPLDCFSKNSDLSQYKGSYKLIGKRFNVYNSNKHITLHSHGKIQIYTNEHKRLSCIDPLKYNISEIVDVSQIDNTKYGAIAIK